MGVDPGTIQSVLTACVACVVLGTFVYVALQGSWARWAKPAPFLSTLPSRYHGHFEKAKTPLDEATFYRFVSVTDNGIAIWRANERRLPVLVRAAEQGHHPVDLHEPWVQFALSDVHDLSYENGRILLRWRPHRGTRVGTHYFRSEMHGAIDLIQGLTDIGWQVQNSNSRWVAKPPERMQDTVEPGRPRLQDVLDGTPGA